MGKENIGVWLFAGVIGLTGLGASGYLGDANKLLAPFKSAPVSTEAPNNAQEASPQSDQDASADAQENTTADDIADTAKAPVTQTDAQVSATVEAPKDTKLPDEIEASDDAVKSEATALQADDEVAQPVEANPINIVPTFDVLRVEPNGDMVIAGVAAANADVEIVAGSKALATAQSNDQGEFVAILDEPLKQGDYEIVLRATQNDGTVATSLETAIVSIPKKGSNDVLALVRAPGEPSRLITKSEIANALQVVETPKPSDTSTDDAKISEVPNLDASEAEKAVVTAAPSESTQVETPQQKAGERVRIEAVEIDGEKVFVAGSTDAGARIRVYANEIVLGEDLANDEGRFLVETNRDLPIGDYVIRADRLSKNGLEVVSRAAVPFARSEGEKVAAVAVPQAPKLLGTPPIAAQAASDEGGQSNKEPTNAGELNVETAGNAATQPKAQQKDEQSDIASTSDTPEAAMPETEVSDGAQMAATNADGIAPTGNVNERLKSVDSSVIIRRGDTLWHISKRVYGQGIKYTTIYQANEDQIKNPDKIWPGQIFALPEKEDGADVIEN